MRNIDFGILGVPKFTIEERPEIEVETNFGVHLYNKEVTEIKNCNTSGY